MTDLERVPPAAPVTVDIDTLRYLGYDPDNVATRALVLLAHRYQLDPLLGEIQLIADSKGRRLYVTRDGMLAVAHASGLGFIPFAEEHYDFALVTARKQRPAVQAFFRALASNESRDALIQAGFRPA